MPAVVLERSSTTKYVVNGRNTLSLESVKAQKVVLSGIRAAGGAHLVPISANMLNSVKMAHSRKVAVDKEKAEAKRKAEEAAAGEQRKEGQEAEQRTLDEKKRRLEDIIREIQEEIMNENESLMAAVSRGSRLKEPAVAQAALKTVEACQNCSWVAAAATKKLECKNHNIRAIVSQKLRTLVAKITIYAHRNFVYF